MFKFKTVLVCAVAVGMLSACATESSRSLEVKTVNAYQSPYHGARVWVSVGSFENRSSMQTGIFSDGEDRLGSQARTILITHLNQSKRFNVLDRSNLSKLNQEAQFSGRAQRVQGARYVMLGDVTGFGRKEVGDHQLFGLLGRGKSQVAYANVALNVVDVASSQIVYSVQGAGEYTLSSREILGFGGRSGYDSTLNGKVLDLAIREAVNQLTQAMDQGIWPPKE